jgi:hypothetical protein
MSFPPHTSQRQRVKFSKIIENDIIGSSILKRLSEHDNFGIKHVKIRRDKRIE